MNMYSRALKRILQSIPNSHSELDDECREIITSLLRDKKHTLKGLRLIGLSEPDLRLDAISALRCPAHSPPAKQFNLKKHAHLCGSAYCDHCGSFDPTQTKDAEQSHFADDGRSKMSDRIMRLKASNRYKQPGWIIRMPDDFCFAVTINLGLATTGEQAVGLIRAFKKRFRSKCQKIGFPFEDLNWHGRFEVSVKPSQQFRANWQSDSRYADFDFDSGDPVGMIHCHLLLMADPRGVENKFVQDVLSEIFHSWFPGPRQVDVRSIKNQFVGEKNRYNEHGVGGWLAYAAKGMKQDQIREGAPNSIRIDDALVYQRLTKAIARMRFEKFPAMHPESYRRQCDLAWCDYNEVCAYEYLDDIFEGPGIKAAIQLDRQSGGSEVYNYTPDWVPVDMKEDYQRGLLCERQKFELYGEQFGNVDG